MTPHDVVFPRSRVGEMVALLVLLAVATAGSALAIWNLAQGTAVILSLIWLILVSFVVRANVIDYGGPRRSSLRLAGLYLGRQFAECSGTGSSPPMLHIGYRILSHRMIMDAHPVAAIAMVEWSMGQASHQQGRDLNDWSLAFWFDHGDPDRSTKRRAINDRHGWSNAMVDQDVFVFASSTPRREAEDLALQLVELLREAGLALSRVEGDNRFIRLLPPAGRGENAS